MLRLVRNISIQIIYLVFFSLVYLPIVRGHYFFSDDYFWQGTILPIALLKTGLTDLGRPLTGFLLYQIFDYINVIESANTVRFIGVIGVGLLAYIIYVIFKTNRFKTEHAFFLSILICTLPSFQIYVSWLVCVPYVYCAVLSALSALIMFKVFFNENRGKTVSSVIAFLTSIVLLITALNIYQSSAMIYWSMAVIPLAMLRGRDFRQKWFHPYLVYFSVGFVSMAIYYVLVKIMLHTMNIELTGRGAFIEITGILGKIKWFFTNPLHYALNLWNIHLSYKITAFAGIFIIAGIFYEILQRRKEKNPVSSRNFFYKYFFIISALLLSFSPNLLILENSGQYRTIVALSATVCILFCYSIISFGDYLKSYPTISAKLRKRTITILLFVLTIISIYHSYNNVNKYFAMLQSTELKYVENVIREYGISNLSETRTIYAISPKTYRVSGLRHEFGKPSSNAIWARTAMIKIALNELGIKQNIPIIHEDIRTDIMEDNNILIVDFRKLNFVFDKMFK